MIKRQLWETVSSWCIYRLTSKTKLEKKQMQQPTNSLINCFHCAASLKSLCHLCYMSAIFNCLNACFTVHIKRPIMCQSMKSNPHQTPSNREMKMFTSSGTKREDIFTQIPRGTIMQFWVELWLWTVMFQGSQMFLETQFWMLKATHRMHLISQHYFVNLLFSSFVLT